MRRAAAGESIVVTQSGRPVAVLGPVGGDRDRARAWPSSSPTAPSSLPGCGPSTDAVERERLPVDARSDVELRKVR